LRDYKIRFYAGDCEMRCHDSSFWLLLTQLFHEEQFNLFFDEVT